MGLLAGMSTALVLTGDSDLDDVEALGTPDRPRYVLETLDQLIPESIWAERQT